jgi:hypothetical protein
LFTEKVSEYRGIDPKQVRSLADGRVYVGQAAVECDLADGIGTLDSIVAALATVQEEGKMSLKPKGTLIAGGLAAISNVITGKSNAVVDEKKDDEQKNVRDKVNEEAEGTDEETDEEEKKGAKGKAAETEADEAEEAEAEEADEESCDNRHSKKAKALMARNINLANATAEDLLDCRPDLVKRIVAEANYTDSKRRSDIHTLIQSAKLPAKATASLHVTLSNASLEKARASVDRSCAIEAALELGRVSGLLKEADEDALRADVEGMRVHGALGYIRSYLEKKEGAKVQTIPVAASAATHTSPSDGKRDELVAKLMAEYPKQKAVFNQLTKASFLAQGLSINGIQATEEELIKAYPEQTKE